MRVGDDTALLDTLAAALAPVAVGPDADEVAAVRELLRKFDDVVVPLEDQRRTRHPVRHALTIAAAVVALVVVLGVVALRTGSSVPRALRAPARALGLPVDSADVADARTAMARLRSALAQDDDQKVEQARAELVTRLRSLSADDRAAVDAEARDLLARADARLRPAEVGDATATTRQATPSEPTVTSEPEAGTGTGDESPDETSGVDAPVPTTVAPIAPPSPTTATTEPNDDPTGRPDS